MNGMNGKSSIPDAASFENTDNQFLPEFEKVEELVFVCISMLANCAMSKLGLGPGKKKEEPSLGEARLAIDSLAALFGVVAPVLDEKMKSEIEKMLSGLRMAFVELSRERKV